MAAAKFIGVYASTRNPGTRAKSSGTPRKSYWFVWEEGWGRYQVQLLDAAFQPLDTPQIVTANEFQKNFTHQPHILVTPIRQLETSPPEEADQPQEKASSRRNRPDAADNEDAFVRSSARDSSFPNSETSEVKADGGEMEAAENLDRELRAEFAMALTKWKRGENRSSLRTFEAMANLSEGIIPAHKHTFTDFAVDLRKSRLPTLAKKHYLKAADLAPEDCNAHFNLARIYYETGEIDKALQHLGKALELEPNFEYALRFERFLQEKLVAQQNKSRKNNSDSLSARS